MGVLRTRSIRWLAPVAVLAMILGGAAWHSVSAGAAPSLPGLSAQQLLVKVAQTRVQSLSGTVAVTTDLGLPPLPGTGDLSARSLLTSGTHTLRVYADGPQRQRVDLLGTAAETDAVHNGRDLWQWSSASRTATHTALPAQTGPAAQRPSAPARELTPQAMATQLLHQVGPSTSVSVGTAASIAGRSAYDLRLTPRSTDSTIGHADIYVDAQTGLPLCVGVTPRHSTTEALDVRYTSLTLARPDASLFRFSPPRGATVKQSPLPTQLPTRQSAAGEHARPTRPAHPGVPTPRVLGTGWSTVAELPGVDLTGALTTNKGRSGDTAGNPLGALLGASTSVTGTYGTGRLLSTRLVSVLLTDDGRVFVGAVTRSALLAAASAAGPR